MSEAEREQQRMDAERQAQEQTSRNCERLKQKLRGLTLGIPTVDYRASNLHYYVDFNAIDVGKHYTLQFHKSQMPRLKALLAPLIEDAKATAAAQRGEEHQLGPKSAELTFPELIQRYPEQVAKACTDLAAQIVKLTAERDGARAELDAVRAGLRVALDIAERSVRVTIPREQGDATDRLAELRKLLP